MADDRHDRADHDWDWSGLRHATLIEDVDHHRELESTNSFALRELEAGVRRERPWLVLAEWQTGGRGRGERVWWAAPGALTFSLVLPEAYTAPRFPPNRLPLMSLLTGLSVCRAIEEAAPGLSPGVKWPNDVLLDSRKVCGILVEVAATRHVVIGIGLNVNNRVDRAGPELQATAHSLLEATGTTLGLEDVLRAILQRFEDVVDGTWEKNLEDYRRRCVLTGLEIAVDSNGQTTRGRCRGIDDLGRLEVESDEGIVEAFVAGTVADW